MPCYKPLKAFRSVQKHESGKPQLTFNPIKAINSALPITLPCGQCIGCRNDKVDAWATRCMHESKMHEHNSFITLTYADEFLPEDYSVHVREFQLFMKRLRKDLNTPIRFFACGEYGPLNLRPHYHALIFGYAFPDRIFKCHSDSGEPLFTSEQLSKAWPYGRSDLGSVTYKSAGYVAGYVRDKITGDPALRHYLRTHPRSGQTVKVEPEFSLQSRRPGIGSTWFDKYHSDAFPSDFLVIDGREKPVPPYYLRKLELLERENVATEYRPHKLHSEDPVAVKRARKLRSASPQAKANRTSDRLEVREYIKTDRIKRLKRNLKDDNQ